MTTHEYREFVVLHAKSGLPLPSEHRRVRGESCCGGRVMPGCTRDGCATQFYVEPQRYKPTAAAFSFVRGHPNVVCIMFHNSNTVRGLPPVPATDTSRRLTTAAGIGVSLRCSSPRSHLLHLWPARTSLERESSSFHVARPSARASARSYWTVRLPHFAPVPPAILPPVGHACLCLAQMATAPCSSVPQPGK